MKRFYMGVTLDQIRALIINTVTKWCNSNGHIPISEHSRINHVMSMYLSGDQIKQHWLFDNVENNVIQISQLVGSEYNPKLRIEFKDRNFIFKVL